MAADGDGGRAASEGDVDLQFLTDRNRHNLYVLIYKLTKLAAVVGCAYIAHMTIVPFAGQLTETHLSALVDLSADRWIAYAIAALCGAGYVLKNKQLQTYVKAHGVYVRKLEQKIDPERSSSRLLTTGEPRKEDRDDF